jgi:hypothetical protein
MTSPRLIQASLLEVPEFNQRVMGLIKGAKIDIGFLLQKVKFFRSLPVYAGKLLSQK